MDENSLEKTSLLTLAILIRVAALTAVVTGVLVGAGVYYYQKIQHNQAEDSLLAKIYLLEQEKRAAEGAEQVAVEGKLTYSNTKYKYSFRYPETESVKDATLPMSKANSEAPAICVTKEGSGICDFSLSWEGSGVASNVPLEIGYVHDHYPRFDSAKHIVTPAKINNAEGFKVVEGDLITYYFQVGDGTVFSVGVYSAVGDEIFSTFSFGAR